MCIVHGCWTNRPQELGGFSSSVKYLQKGCLQQPLPGARAQRMGSHQGLEPHPDYGYSQGWAPWSIGPRKGNGKSRWYQATSR